MWHMCPFQHSCAERKLTLRLLHQPQRRRTLVQSGKACAKIDISRSTYLLWGLLRYPMGPWRPYLLDTIESCTSNSNTMHLGWMTTNEDVQAQTPLHEDFATLSFAIALLASSAPGGGGALQMGPPIA